MNEIERKLLISNRPKRTRRLIVTIAIVGLLIATAVLVGASLIGFYYKQTAEVNVTPLVTITYGGETYAAGWEETNIIIGAEPNLFYPGDEYSSGIYKIAYVDRNPEPPDDPEITVYIHIDVTETPPGGAPVPCTGGLTVEVVWVGGNPINSQIVLNPGEWTDFEIHVTADADINANYAYAYTITMDWNI